LQNVLKYKMHIKLFVLNLHG